MKNDTRKIYKICLTGAMAAVIAVCIFAVRFPIASGQGYIHIGDALVYLSGCLLGTYGIIASALGGALADLLSGYPVWALPTATIKAVNVLPFLLAIKFYKKKSDKAKCISIYTVIASVASGFITVFGYALVEVFLYSKEAAFADMIPNTIQAAASALMFIIIGSAIDKIKR